MPEPDMSNPNSLVGTKCYLPPEVVSQLADNQPRTWGKPIEEYDGKVRVVGMGMNYGVAGMLHVLLG